MHRRWITAVLLTAAVGFTGCSSTDDAAGGSGTVVALDDVTETVAAEDEVHVEGDADVDVDFDEVEEFEYVEPLREFDARTTEVLRAWADALTASKQFSFTGEATTQEFISTGQSIDLHASAKVVVRRPGGLWVDRVADGRHRRLHFDGAKVALHDVPRAMYAQAEFSGTVDELLERLAEKYNTSIPLSDLAAADPYDALSEFADEGHFVGTHVVRGVPCHHLVFSNDALAWQMWVQAEGDPVLRQLTIIYKDEPGLPRYSAFLDNWNLNDTTPASNFTFTPPAGSTQVELVSTSDGDESADEDEGVEEDEGVDGGVDKDEDEGESR